MPSAHLRIDTSVVGVPGPSSSHSSARNGGSTAGGSRALSAKSMQRLRSASSASTSSTSSNPTYALSKASLSANPHDGRSSPWSPTESSEGVPDNSEYVLAMHDFEPQHQNVTCLSFRAGQIIRVLNRDQSGWWDGELDGRRGWFPSNYVTSDVALLTDEELPQLMVSSLVCCARWKHIASYPRLTSRPSDPRQKMDMHTAHRLPRQLHGRVRYPRKSAIFPVATTAQCPQKARWTRIVLA